MINLEHDFTGRPVLEKVKQNPDRTIVTLVWNVDDILLDMPLVVTLALPEPDRSLDRSPFAGTWVEHGIIFLIAETGPVLLSFPGMKPLVT